MLNTLKEKLGSLNRKKLIAGFVILIVLLALPVALFLVNQSQDTRQQAAGTGDQVKLSLNLAPSATIINTTTPPKILKGSPFEVKLYLDTKGRNVVNMTTQINYDQTKFTLNSIDTTGGVFSTYLPNLGTGAVPAGNARLVATVANPATPVNGNNLLVATYKFTATSNTSQLGKGVIFFTNPTEITEQNPGSNNTALLTYEFTQAEYEIVDSLPATSTTPLTGGAIKLLFPTISTPPTTVAAQSVGYRFSPVTNGVITQLWCYGTGDNSNVALWTHAGAVVKLAEATVSCPNGWNVVTLPTPLTVTKNTNYRLAVTSTTLYTTGNITADTITGGIKILGSVTSQTGSSGFPAGFPSSYSTTSTFTVQGIPDVTFVSTESTSAPANIQLTTLSPTSLTTNSATARATINPGGKSVNVYFKYGPTNGQCSSLASTSSVIGNTNPNTTTSRSISISGLTANTTYYICAVAKDNADGALTFGNVISFTTKAVAGTTQAPSAVPSTIAASPSVTTPATSNSPIPVSLTPLPSPNATQADINLTLKLPGIGNNAGGSKNLGENNTPQHMTRTFDVFLFNTDGQQTGSAFPAQLTYSPQEGAFKGTVRISGIPLNTAYSIKVKSDNSLARNIGIVNNLASGQTISINANNPSGELVTGKINLETPNLIGIQDYNDFMNCYNNLPSCTPATRAKADFTDDSKIDLKDLNILLYAFANRQGD